MMKFALSTCLLLQASLISAEVLKLSDNDFLEKTSGRAVFISFCAPWSEACQEMTPHLEQLAKDWEGHEVGLVAEIDCTEEDSEPVCDDFEVENFPTVYFGDPMSPEVYGGELTYEAMSAFAKENISTPPCSIKNLKYCDEEMNELIEDLLKKTKEELELVEDEVQERLAVAQAVYDGEIEELNAKFEETVRDFNEQVEVIRDETNFKWVQQVILKKEQDAAEEL